MSTRHSILMAAPLALLLPAVLLALLGAWSRRTPPRGPGPSDGRLSACPASPNCVSSSGGTGRQRLQPLRYEAPADEARRRLIAVLEDDPRATIVSSTSDYMRAEFHTPLFGFVDDVEFLFDDEAGRIDFRSASRVGYSDFGANRRRMEEIRRRFAMKVPA